ncbi:MAG: hypothetical protein JW803_00830 [Endomicrobiales bacterium]|nr:hypothetical protein [Endomicrobiales bacterium]
MKLNDFLLWQRLILLGGIFTVIMGMAMSLFGNTGPFIVYEKLVNPVFWPSGAPEGVAFFQRWVYGVVGAVMAGWGVFIVFIAQVPFLKKENWAWQCIFWGMTVWYVPDTLLSVWYGVYFNAVLNTVMYLFVLVPLLLSKKYFIKA